jgi:hypothetical protein
MFIVNIWIQLGLRFSINFLLTVFKGRWAIFRGESLGIPNFRAAPRQFEKKGNIPLLGEIYPIVFPYAPQKGEFEETFPTKFSHPTSTKSNGNASVRKHFPQSFPVPGVQGAMGAWPLPTGAHPHLTIFNLFTCQSHENYLSALHSCFL